MCSACATSSWRGLNARYRWTHRAVARAQAGPACVRPNHSQQSNCSDRTAWKLWLRYPVCGRYRMPIARSNWFANQGLRRSAARHPRVLCATPVARNTCSWLPRKAGRTVCVQHVTATVARRGDGAAIGPDPTSSVPSPNARRHSELALPARHGGGRIAIAEFRANLAVRVDPARLIVPRAGNVARPQRAEEARPSRRLDWRAA